jgi:hypothetical protein
MEKVNFTETFLLLVTILEQNMIDYLKCTMEANVLYY